MFLCQIDDDGPQNCPPEAAVPLQADLFRMVRALPADSSHLEPDVVMQPDKANRQLCQCWGCSVWMEPSAVRNALKIFKFFRDQHVVKVAVDEDDGRLMPTPNGRQPEHHTFWKVHQREIAGPFTTVYTQGRWV